MTAGTYGGGVFGTGWGLGGGLYIDNHGRIYPQLYSGTPRFGFSAGYTPDLEGLLTGPSISVGPGRGPIRYNVGGNTETIGAGIGTPGIGVTHGFGPLELSPDYSQPWITPAIRNSAAGAGVPSRFNVFEYGYPDFDVGPPNFDGRRSGSERSSTQPQGLAARLMDHIRRMNEQHANESPASVFDTGVPAVPFVPDEGEGSLANRFGDRFPIRRLSSPLDRR